MRIPSGLLKEFIASLGAKAGTTVDAYERELRHFLDWISQRIGNSGPFNTQQQLTKVAREHIFKRVAASVPNGLAGRLEDLLAVKLEGNSSGLQTIKANPSKPSVDAMLTLLDKLKVIEATGVLGVDLSWLNGNYQRAKASLWSRRRKTVH